MNKTTLTHAIRLALATHIGVAVLAVAPGVQAQQTLRGGVVAPGVLQPVDVNVTRVNHVALDATVESGGSGKSAENGLSFSHVPNLASARDSRMSSRPVQTLTADDLRRANVVNVESVLNTLPQIIPGFDRTSNNPGEGNAAVDIRGLGSERTVVLVNDRPFVPYGSNGAADLNAIPQALIKQIDVGAGGSSVQHGSGAIAGTVNFILDEHFQGAELNVSHQSSFEQDGKISSVELTVGSDFASGKGNIAVSLGGSERDSVFASEREFSTFLQTDDVDQNGSPVLSDGGSTGVPGTAIFSAALGAFSNSFAGIFDPDGSIRPFQTGMQNDYYNYAPVNYLQIPQRRRHATAISNFEIADSLELYGLGMFSQTETVGQLAPTPIFQNGTEFTLDGSPFLPPATQQFLSDTFGNGVDTDGDGIDDTATAFVRRRLLESGPRRRSFDSDSLYIQIGLRGQVGSYEYDIYASRGSTDRLETQEGNISRSRFLQTQLLDLQADPNGGVCQQTSSDSIGLDCVPANIFGEGNISLESAEFFRAGVVVESESTRTIYGASLSRKLGSLFRGDAHATLGVERRNHSFDSEWITINLADADDLAGFDSVENVEGETSSNSFYGDVYLPLVHSIKGAALIDLAFGYRLTDYDTFGNVASFDVNGSWAPTEFIKFRAGYNSAHRAPDVTELFSSQGMGFQSGTDLCVRGGLSAELAAICIATGVPPELAEGPPTIGVQGSFPFITGGNTELQEEQADTFSAGIEIDIPFGGGGSFRAGADYFSIDGSEGIAAFGGNAGNVFQQCYDPSNSTPDSLSVYCDVINRRADGLLESIEITQQNVALYEVEGVDLHARATQPAWGGSLGIDYNGTVLNKHQFSAFEGANSLECAGKFGALCGEPVPSYSHRISTGWSRGNMAASLTWRLVGEVDDDDDTSLYFVEKLDSENYFDAEVDFKLGHSVVVGIGIKNLTDREPPVIGSNQEQSNTFPATYDPYGRSYFVRLLGSM